MVAGKKGEWNGMGRDGKGQEEGGRKAKGEWRDQSGSRDILILSFWYTIKEGC